MVRIFRYKKSVSTLLILAYLLISSGVSNALLWCQKSSTYSHLEYNLAGKCHNGCHPAEGNHATGRRTDISPILMTVEAGCLDTPVSLSHVPTPGLKNLPVAPVSPVCFSFHLSPISHLAAFRLAWLNLAAQPPPSQALAALRTIVLQN